MDGLVYPLSHSLLSMMVAQIGCRTNHFCVKRKQCIQIINALYKYGCLNGQCGQIVYFCPDIDVIIDKIPNLDTF